MACPEILMKMHQDKIVSGQRVVIVYQGHRVTHWAAIINGQFACFIQYRKKQTDRFI
jgi:hypothetical protein